MSGEVSVSPSDDVQEGRKLCRSKKGMKGKGCVKVERKKNIYPGKVLDLICRGVKIV